MKGTVAAIIFGLFLAALSGEILLRILAVFFPNVAYLAHAGLRTTRPVSGNLQEFLAFAEFQIHPFTDFYGYSTNNFGFIDKDFELPKPKGRTRVLAIGDSFVHGTVPYPANVLTQVEDHVHAKCPGEDFEILNLGVSGAGVFEYDELLHHLKTQFEPDLVLLHFYVGNDGPDVYHNKDTFPRSFFWAFDSAVLRFLWNSWIVLRGADVVSLGATPGPQTKYTKGAQKTDLNYDFRDDRPPLKGPTIFGDAWARIVRDEMLHFYTAHGDENQIQKSWKRVFTTLAKIKTSLDESHIPLALVIYPSELQIDAEKKAFGEKVIAEKQKNPVLPPEDFDFFLPNKTLAAFCEAKGIPCFDVTAELKKECAEAGRSCYIPQNTHWNILGNAIAGKSEAEQVSSLVCEQAARNRLHVTP